MFAVEGVFDGASVHLNTADLPVHERCKVLVTFLNPTKQTKISQANVSSISSDREKRRAAFNRLAGLTADNPVSLEEARNERLSKQ
jgi:hypothetical protein